MNKSAASQLFMGQLGIQHADGRAWNEGGKGMSVRHREAGENISDWKVATDSTTATGKISTRMVIWAWTATVFQISWSRVCPQGDGEFNDEGIAFYDRFIDDLLARGIEPMVCLYHLICRWRWRRSTTASTIAA